MKLRGTFGFRIDPDTGVSCWVQTGLALDVRGSGLPDEAFERLRDLLEPAGLSEIVVHLGRLALHRRKGGLTEAALPLFLEDVARDLMRVRVSSLGVAVLAEQLRLEAVDAWFPAWGEIEPLALAIEDGLRRLRNGESAPKEIAAPVFRMAEPQPAPDMAEVNRRWDEIEANLKALGVTLAAVPRGMDALEWTRLALAAREGVAA